MYSANPSDDGQHKVLIVGAGSAGLTLAARLRRSGRAVVVDPRRDVSEYLADAQARGLAIEAVINTHFHADFAAGHLELAAATGAWIGYGRRAAEVEFRPAGEQEVITRLGRIGFDTVAGYLGEPEAAFLAVPGEVGQASRLMASDLREALGRDRPPTVLDVRNAGERAEGAIDGSLHIPLAELPRRLSEVPAGTPVVVYCAAGSRSSIAASLLRRSGYRDVSDLIGGEAAWRLSLTPAR